MNFTRYKPNDKRISAGDMNRRADAIEGLMREGPQYPKIYEDPVLLAKITSNDGAGSYTARIETTSGSVCTLQDGLTITVKEAGLASDVAVGTYIIVKPIGNCYFFVKGGSGTSVFPCKITGHLQIANGSTTVGGGASVSVDYKWAYAWSEMERTGDTVQVKSGGRSGTTTTDYAINEAEINHTVVLSWGATINLAPYPLNFRPKAVGGANAATDQTVHSYDVIVDMQQVTEVGSSLTKYRFNKNWFHGGVC